MFLCKLDCLFCGIETMFDGFTILSLFNFYCNNQLYLLCGDNTMFMKFENTFLLDEKKTLYCLKYETFVFKKSLDKMDKTTGLFYKKK